MQQERSVQVGRGCGLACLSRQRLRRRRDSAKTEAPGGGRLLRRCGGGDFDANLWESFDILTGTRRPTDTESATRSSHSEPRRNRIIGNGTTATTTTTTTSIIIIIVVVLIVVQIGSGGGYVHIGRPEGNETEIEEVPTRINNIRRPLFFSATAVLNSERERRSEALD